MPLASETRLGPYLITGLLGTGGMGEVYRARDTRLHRTVAIKILSPALTNSPEFRSRFEREARAIASLNHPYVCTVYDFGQHDGMHYLVMEYVEGESLAERLRRGPLRFQELITYAVQIAQALDHAHRQGQVHRDVKPANVILGKNGAKLLDFGLARPVAPRTHSVGGISTAPLTDAGTIVGTYPYMSPEQLHGREADVRSDVFSFGALVYEMATGKRAFVGESTASVIAAVLERDPTLVSSLRPGLPHDLDWLIGNCLKKDANERWQTLHDIKLELLHLFDAPLGSPPPDRTIPWRRGTVAAAAGLALLLAATMTLRRGQTMSLTTTVGFELLPPTGGAFATAQNASVPVVSMAVSPDGRRLAYVAERHSAAAMIWVRSLEDSVPRALPGTEGAQALFWAPDSRFLAFFTHDALRKIDVTGGPPITICESSNDPRGGAWLPSGVIVFAPSHREGLMRVPATGGRPEPVFAGNNESRLPRWFPSALPDGKRFLYYERTQGTINVGSIDGTVGRPIATTNWGAAYVQPGFLLYLSSDTLMAQPFDPQNGSVSGEAMPVANGVGGSTNGMPGFSASDSGVLLHSPVLIPTTRLSWYDRRGNLLRAVSDPGQYVDFRLSPDGQRTAWSRVEPHRMAQDLWLYDNVRTTVTRLTSDPLLEATPLWSPDSTKILYRANRTGLINLYLRDLRGGADEALFTSEAQLQPHGGSKNTIPTDWSSDGRYVVYTVSGKTSFDLFALPLAAPRIPFPLSASAFNEIQGSLSPDLRWVAFTSDESGRFEVYVQNFPDGRNKRQVSAAGASEPRWRADGRELLYIDSAGRITAIEFNDGLIGNTKPLFNVRTPAGIRAYVGTYQPTGDAQRFLVNSLHDDNTPVALNVLVNWPALLKR